MWINPRTEQLGDNYQIIMISMIKTINENTVAMRPDSNSEVRSALIPLPSLVDKRTYTDRVGLTDAPPAGCGSLVE